jgi:hypothetical protein
VSYSILLGTPYIKHTGYGVPRETTRRLRRVFSTSLSRRSAASADPPEIHTISLYMLNIAVRWNSLRSYLTGNEAAVSLWSRWKFILVLWR